MTMARRRVPSSGFRPTQESAPVGQYDWGLIALFLMLLCIGLLMVRGGGTHQRRQVFLF